MLGREFQTGGDIVRFRDVHHEGPAILVAGQDMRRNAGIVPAKDFGMGEVADDFHVADSRLEEEPWTGEETLFVQEFRRILDVRETQNRRLHLSGTLMVTDEFLAEELGETVE